MPVVNPRNLPEVRHNLSIWNNLILPKIYLQYIKASKQRNVPKNMSEDSAAAYLASSEVGRLELADLFFVTPEMTSLAQGAAETMPPFQLLPEDIPTKFGFIVFPQTIAINPDPQGEVHLAAACWGTWHNCPPQWLYDGIWISFYSDIELTTGQPIVNGNPTFILDGEAQIPFNAPNPFDLQKDHPYQAAMRIIRTAWVLMQQKGLSEISIVQAARAARRRLERVIDVPLKGVQVIGLRRFSSELIGSEETEKREYFHRWIVNGHWRQQWYPSIEAHRPIWISPYVKGPEDAPFNPQQKVFSWRR